MAKYKCPTLGDCDKANAGELFERAPGDDLKCPGCGTLLDLQKSPAAAAGPTKKVLLAGGLATVALLVMAGLFLGKPAALPAAAPSHAASGAGETTVLRLSGSNTVGSVLAPQLVKAWLLSKGANDVTLQARQEDGKPAHESIVRGQLDGKSIRVAVRAHGSKEAFQHLSDGSADIGMASRPVQPAEKSSLAALGDMNSRSNEHVIALDGIAVVVGPGNPVTALARQDLARIFTGEVSDWSQLGAGSGAIHLYARDEKSGTFDTFKALVLKSGALAAGARRLEDSAELEQAVSRDPAAIGFVGLAYVKTARAVPVSDGANTVALIPTLFTVKKEDYALSRRLYFYTASAPANQYVTEFVRFTQSEAGQQVVKAAGFVDQNISMATARPVQAGDRPCLLGAQWRGSREAYCKLIAGKSDVGTNVRFQSGSSVLDNRAGQDLQRLLKLMADDAGRRLTLIGFSDADGKYDSNRSLSEGRANAVKLALHTLGITNVEAHGFGQEQPVSNNDTPDGKQRNRRVEIWVH